ncbi:MAG: Holliday junction resolvase RecU, partial [Vallitaleaceae bacterium]|nr:Holliday junction resolvase RecU [Vallitaleaceae bacterium]
MSTWAKRGLRGSTLESYINITNDKYREQGLALVEKIPTPITPVKLNPEKGNISEAYFEKRSSVDYIGVVQGIPICFDAKETNKDLLPLQNIHPHQVAYMADFTKQKGIA